MTEYIVTLQKTRLAEVTVEAKDQEEAEKKAMDIYYNGDVEWDGEDVEVMETEEI